MGRAGWPEVSVRTFLSKILAATAKPNPRRKTLRPKGLSYRARRPAKRTGRNACPTTAFKHSVRCISGGRCSCALQPAVEEVTGGAVTREPVAMQKEIVDIVWENELLDGNAARAESGNEVDRL